MHVLWYPPLCMLVTLKKSGAKIFLLYNLQYGTSLLNKSYIISTDEDLGLRIENSAKIYIYLVFLQTKTDNTSNH
jgi:hypothetical protein